MKDAYHVQDWDDIMGSASRSTCRKLQLKLATCTTCIYANISSDAESTWRHNDEKG